MKTLLALVLSVLFKPTFALAAAGHLLLGDPSANAVGQMIRYDGEPGEVDTSTSRDEASGSTIYSTRLNAALTRTATVDQVNSALNAVNGLIVASTEGSTLISIQIPGPGGVSALLTAVDSLMRSGVFQAVSIITVPILDKNL